MPQHEPTLFPIDLFPDLHRLDPGLHTTGLLPSQHIEGLIASSRVTADRPFVPEQIQPASLDLRIGRTAYRVRAGFLPGPKGRVRDRLQSLIMHEVDLSDGAVLERGCVYVIPLLEIVNLPGEVSARANPKSTIGRLDVFTRLVHDYGIEYDRIPAGYTGQLYVEVVPRTFSVVVRTGTRLNQIRFMRGGPPTYDLWINELHKKEILVYSREGQPAEANIKDGLRLSIDLLGGEPGALIGYRAKKNAPLLDLLKIDHYDVEDFWEPIASTRSGQLILDPDDFYILASQEQVRVPPTWAADMVPYDPSIGEFRIHYAGFFDPGFGFGANGEILGTRAVLEVRSHEAPFLLEDGQVVGRLVYERLMGVPAKVYGQTIGSSYQAQGVALSKQFKRRLPRGAPPGSAEPPRPSTRSSPPIP